MKTNLVSIISFIFLLSVLSESSSCTEGSLHQNKDSTVTTESPKNTVAAGDSSKITFSRIRISKDSLLDVLKVIQDDSAKTLFIQFQNDSGTSFRPVIYAGRFSGPYTNVSSFFQVLPDSAFRPVNPVLIGNLVWKVPLHFTPNPARRYYFFSAFQQAEHYVNYGFDTSYTNAVGGVTFNPIPPKQP